MELTNVNTRIEQPSYLESCHSSSEYFLRCRGEAGILILGNSGRSPIQFVIAELFSSTIEIDSDIPSTLYFPDIVLLLQFIQFFVLMGIYIQNLELSLSTLFSNNFIDIQGH